MHCLSSRIHGAALQMYLAARKGDVETLNACLKEPDIAINEPLQIGDWILPALGHAVLSDAPKGVQLHIMTTLLEKGADPKVQGRKKKNKGGYKHVTPLHLVQTAAAANKLLDAKGAKVDINAMSGRGTPITEAVAQGRVEVVRALRDRGADLAKSSLDGKNPVSVSKSPKVKSANFKLCKDLITERVAAPLPTSDSFQEKKRRVEEKKAKSMLSSTVCVDFCS